MRLGYCVIQPLKLSEVALVVWLAEPVTVPGNPPILKPAHELWVCKLIGLDASLKQYSSIEIPG